MKPNFYVLVAAVALSLAVGIVLKDSAIAVFGIVGGAVAGVALKVYSWSKTKEL